MAKNSLSTVKGLLSSVVSSGIPKRVDSSLVNLPVSTRNFKRVINVLCFYFDASSVVKGNKKKKQKAEIKKRLHNYDLFSTGTNNTVPTPSALMSLL